MARPPKCPAVNIRTGGSALGAPILPNSWQQCGSKLQLCVFWTDLIATDRSRASSGLALPHPGSVYPAVDFVSSKSSLDKSVRPSSHSSTTPCQAPFSSHTEAPHVLVASASWKVVCFIRHVQVISWVWRACCVSRVAVFSISLCRSKSLAVSSHQQRSESFVFDETAWLLLVLRVHWLFFLMAEDFILNVHVVTKAFTTGQSGQRANIRFPQFATAWRS